MEMRPVRRVSAPASAAEFERLLSLNEPLIFPHFSLLSCLQLQEMLGDSVLPVRVACDAVIEPFRFTTEEK
jgi:hypothetical protein